jgi:L-lactate dehydrogenase complex protein LldF
MGIEKLLPRIEDLEVFLRLLPRSGTGQHLTSYQSLFTGPKKSEDEEGPSEMHVLILDNGRSAMLKRPITRQSLACIRCGACLNACPVYRQVGGHAYGSVYPGPIGAVITPQLAGVEKAAQLPFASSLCGACRDVCPVRIDIPRLLLHLRSEIVAARPRARRAERLGFRIWAWLSSGRRRYEWCARLARLAQVLVARRGVIGRVGRVLARLIPPLGSWTAERDLAALAPRSFRQIWRAREGGR